MKKFVLGMLTMLLISNISYYLWLNSEVKTKVYNTSSFVLEKIVHGRYILDPIMGNCRDEMAKNGFGWKFNVADYYKCDRFQRLLNGNHKPINHNSSTY